MGDLPVGDGFPAIEGHLGLVYRPAGLIKRQFYTVIITGKLPLLLNICLCSNARASVFLCSGVAQLAHASWIIKWNRA